MSLTEDLLEEYKTACNYPSILDEKKVEIYLTEYLSSLGINRRVKRICNGWDIDDYPDIKKNALFVLDKALAALAARDAGDALAARAAGDARAARDALAARDAGDARAARDAGAALKRFVCWCISYGNWYYWNWDLSWIATYYFGALSLNNTNVLKWSKPLYQAFVSGAYILYWTEETLYWVAKPILHKQPNSRRLHSNNSPAYECDLEDLFFLNGVLVPEWLVMTDAGKIDPEKALTEKNVDVQREIIRKIGAERMLKACNAKTLDVFVDQHTKGGNEYKLMEMKVGTINRKYLYFEHASLPGVWYAQPINPEIQKALHARAWMLGIGEHDELKKKSDRELIACLPVEVS